VDYLSFIPVGIPASSRLVFRQVYPQIVVVTPPAVTEQPGGGNDRRRRRRGTVIRYSDFESREAYEAALRAAIPVVEPQTEPVSFPLAAVPEDGEADDRAIIHALLALGTLPAHFVPGDEDDEAILRALLTLRLH